MAALPIFGDLTAGTSALSSRLILPAMTRLVEAEALVENIATGKVTVARVEVVGAIVHIEWRFLMDP